MTNELRELEGMPMKGKPYFDAQRWVSPQIYLEGASYAKLRNG